MTRLAWPLTALGFIPVALTGVWGWLVHSGLHGWLLFAHVAVAPVLLVGVALLTLRCAVAMQFGGTGSPRVSPVHKLLFWLFLATFIACAGAMLAAMTSLAGYTDQLNLITAHRVTGLALVGLATLYLVTSPLARRT